MTKIPMKRLRRFGIGTGPGKLGWDDYGKIGVGALIAFFGLMCSAAAVLLSDAELQSQLIWIGGSVTAAGCAVLGNIGRKFLSDTRGKP
jgi:hypothetical protein|tara:strand:- start:117 stop:383 length:267 start_codon:yes stop_codon:yes gene_type:complete